MHQRLRRVVRVCRRRRGYAASRRRASRKVQGGDRKGSSSLTKRGGEQGARCCRLRCLPLLYGPSCFVRRSPPRRGVLRCLHRRHCVYAPRRSRRRKRESGMERARGGGDERQQSRVSLPCRLRVCVARALLLSRVTATFVRNLASLLFPSFVFFVL